MATAEQDNAPPVQMSSSMCDYTTHVTIDDDHTTCVDCGETIDDE